MLNRDDFDKPTDLSQSNYSQYESAYVGLVAAYDYPALKEALESQISRELDRPFLIVAQDPGHYKKFADTDPHELLNNVKLTLKADYVPTEGTKILSTNGVFGYKPQKTKVAGVISYIVTDEKNEKDIVELVFPNERNLELFIENLVGKSMTEIEITRVRNLNMEIFKVLRSNPLLQEKLNKFAESRRWPKDLNLQDRANLAYLSKNTVDIVEHATSLGYTIEDLYRSGWVKRTFDEEGNEHYEVRDGEYNIIRIPFFNAKGEIVAWRTRFDGPVPEGESKYKSYPLDRADTTVPDISALIFNAQVLEKAEGLPLIIAEGEFKALVAQNMTGINSIGARGIYKLDSDILSAIKKANPSEVIVVFDRDKDTAGGDQPDGVTNSQRWMYRTALDLENLGLEAYVIHLPYTKGNSKQKVGIDDYLLNGGDIDTLFRESTMKPADYAKIVGLDTFLDEMHKERSHFLKLIRSYETQLTRGGERLDAEVESKIYEFLDNLTIVYKAYLQDRYGRRQIMHF